MRDHLCKSIVSKKYFKFFMKGGYGHPGLISFFDQSKPGELKSPHMVSVVSIVNIIYSN